jgi:hypothetical protein
MCTGGTGAQQVTVFPVALHPGLPDSVRKSLLRYFANMLKVRLKELLAQSSDTGTNPASAQSEVKSLDSATSFEVENLSQGLQTDYLRVMQK